MYLGRIVEIAAVDELYSSPTHPYTQALLSAIPVPDPRSRQRRIALASGDVPALTTQSRGCVFYPRCPHPRKDAECLRSMPELQLVDPGHGAACVKNRMPPGRD
jgi:oligopeptide/dipeptide ABC transporter ATP-binding protein